MKHTVSEVVLKNGARGLIIHVPGASVMTFDMNFRAGEYLVPKEKWETPHLMEHILLGANEEYPKARAFQAEVEKNGAYCNASTGSYEISYEAECADFEWQRVFELLITAITKPLFLKEEFESESGNVREELTARSNNHFRRLSLELREAYGFYVLPDQKRLKLMRNVGLADIKDHYHNTHTTSNMRFVVAGNLPSSRRRIVKQLLENMALPKGRGRKPLPVEKPNKLEAPLHIRNKTVKNYYFYLDTFVGRQLEDAEIDALGLLNSMLTETLYSRILGTARERGLVYGMSSGINRSKYHANWWFGAQVGPDNAPALLEIMISELQKVFKGKLTRQDIEDAKQYALGRYQRSAQTVSGISNGYGHRYFFDDVIEDYYKVPDQIKAINKQRIVDSAQSLFSEDIWGFGVLGGATNEPVKELYQQISELWKSSSK